MLRIGYLIPRLLLLLAVCWLLRLGIDPAVRFWLQAAGTSALGARLDIGRVNIAPARGNLYAENVQVTDPQDPRVNLFQFEQAWLAVSNEALLERRLMVPHAIVAGLEFDVPRNASGKVERDSSGDDADGSLFADLQRQLATEGSEAATRWFADFESRIESELRREFRSIDLADELVARWSGESNKVQSEIEVWKERIERYQELVRTARDNPLQIVKTLDQSLMDLQTTQQDILVASREIERLTRQLAADKQAVADAKEHDVEKLKQLARVENLDPQALAEYLLGEELHRRVQHIGTWVARGRQMADYFLSEPELNQQSGRGVTFPFGSQSELGFLVQKLAFSGQIRGDNVTFSGRARNLTFESRELGQPAIVNLSTVGSVQAQVRCEFDLRGDVPTYHLIAKCPRMNQPGYQLGDTNVLAVEVAPSPGQLWVDLRVTGDQITGDIRWRQDELVMTPEMSTQSGQYGNAVSGTLQRALADVNRLHAQVRLSGDIQKPAWKLNSSLGNDLSEGIRVAAERQLTDASQQLVTLLDQELAQRLGQLDQLLTKRQTSLSEVLEATETIQQQLSDRWQAPLKRFGFSEAAELLRR